MDLAPRQAEVLRAVECFCRTHGHSPTIREVQEATGASSPSTTYETLVQLRDLGMVTWNPKKFRTLRPTTS